MHHVLSLNPPNSYIARTREKPRWREEVGGNERWKEETLTRDPAKERGRRRFWIADRAIAAAAVLAERKVAMRCDRVRGDPLSLACWKGKGFSRFWARSCWHLACVYLAKLLAMGVRCSASQIAPKLLDLRRISSLSVSFSLVIQKNNLSVLFF